MFSDVQRSSHWNGLKINLNPDWITSLESRSYIEELLNSDGTRKVFNLFDSPPIPKIVHASLKPEVKKFKIYMIGKPGVGKTSTTQTLLGINQDGKVYESMGLIVQTLYWPVCQVGKDPSRTKVVLVHLEVWECGARASAKYPYLMEQCVENAHACLLMFSLTDRKSWDEMPNLMGKVGEYPLLQVFIPRLFDLNQGCSNHGPRATCGSRNHSLWPADNSLVFIIHIHCLNKSIRTPHWRNSPYK